MNGTDSASEAHWAKDKCEALSRAIWTSKPCLCFRGKSWKLGLRSTTCSFSSASLHETCPSRHVSWNVTPRTHAAYTAWFYQKKKKKHESCEISSCCCNLYCIWRWWKKMILKFEGWSDSLTPNVEEDTRRSFFFFFCRNKDTPKEE